MFFLNFGLSFVSFWVESRSFFYNSYFLIVDIYECIDHIVRRFKERCSWNLLAMFLCGSPRCTQYTCLASPSPIQISLETGSVLDGKCYVWITATWEETWRELIWHDNFNLISLQLPINFVNFGNKSESKP